MSVVCSCKEAFGDLQYREGPEKYNAFGEKVTDHRCPKCGSLVKHNWDTGDNWNPDDPDDEDKRAIE